MIQINNLITSSSFYKQHKVDSFTHVCEAVPAKTLSLTEMRSSFYYSKNLMFLQNLLTFCVLRSSTITTTEVATSTPEHQW